MNPAPRIRFTALLDSGHLRNSTSGNLLTVKNHELLQESDTPSLRYEGEGVTLCPTCNGAGYELVDHHDARRCIQCNGDGTAR